MATDIKALGDQIVGLTLLEAKALADYLKETHGIEAAGGVVMAAPAALLPRHSPCALINLTTKFSFF